MSIGLAQLATAFIAGQNPGHVTFSLAQTAGDSNIILLEWVETGISPAGPVISMQDDAGNSYSRVYGPLTGTITNISFEIWQANNIASFAPGNKLDVIMTDNFQLVSTAYWAFEVHTTVGTMVKDRDVSNTATSSNSVNTGTTALTSFANEILFAYGEPSIGAALPPGAPWIDATSSTVTGSDVAYQIVSAKGTFDATFTSGGPLWNWAAHLVTFGDGIPNPTTSTGSILRHGHGSRVTPPYNP